MAISNFPHGVRSQILLVAFADVQRQLFFFYEDFWRLRRHLVENTEYCLFELPAAVFTRREPPKRLLIQSDQRVQDPFGCATRPISERRYLG